MTCVSSFVAPVVPVVPVVPEHYWLWQLPPAQQRLLELAAVAREERVLEVACGTGLVTFPVAQAVGPTGSVVATDVSQALVSAVADEARACGFDHVTAACMNAGDLQVPDQSVDAVLCALGLMYVANPRGALREMHRVLRPGGRAVVAVWGARDACGWAGIFPIVHRRTPTEEYPMFFRLGTGANLRRAMTRARFVDVIAERASSILRYDSEEEACNAAFAAGPLAVAYSRFAACTRDEAHAEYLASIARWRRGRGYEIPAEFVVARGRRM